MVDDADYRVQKAVMEQDANRASPDTIEVQAEPSPTDADLLRERIANISSSVTDAYRRGRFMIAVCSIEGGNMYREWHTHDFPVDDLEKVADLLKSDFRNEAHATTKATILPEATLKAPRPMDVMFGKKKQDE